MFSCEFCEISKNTFFTELLWATVSAINKDGVAISKNLVNINPFNANSTKLSNTLKQFVSNLPTNRLSVFGHFAGLALKGLKD